MTFQILVRRRRYLLTLAALILSIIYSFPVFATAPVNLFKNNFPRLIVQTIIADSSNPSPQPEQSVSLFQQLNLTEQQHEQLNKIYHQYRQQIFKKKDIIAKLQQQLSDMMVGTESVELLRQKNQELNLMRQEMSLLRFESMLATREILTPQQRHKFRKLVKLQLGE
jgi:periplasmic protein CpxP/Spy